MAGLSPFRHVLFWRLVVGMMEVVMVEAMIGRYRRPLSPGRGCCLRGCSHFLRCRPLPLLQLRLHLYLDPSRPFRRHLRHYRDLHN